MKRTKKFLVGLLACLSVFSGSLGLAACNEDESFSNSNSSNVEQGSDSNVSSDGENTSEGENNSDGENNSGDENGSEEESGSNEEGTVNLSQGLGYSLLSNGTYSIVANSLHSKKDLVIPSSYNGKAVTSIGKSVFSGCTSLENVTIPDSITVIGDFAFSDCDGLKSITIPNSVTSIGDFTFFGCNSLTSITVEEGGASYKSIDGNLYSYSEKKDAQKTKVVTLLQYAIGKTDTSFTIPDDVTAIGGSAFSECISLTSITMPNGVTSISSSAFFDCSNLQFNEYDNAKYLGSKTNDHFALIKAKDKNFSGYTIHKDTKIIAGSALSKCDGLADLTIPDGVISICDYAFYDCDSLTTIIIPDSVTSIGGYAFSKCDALTKVVIPDEITFVGTDAFSACGNLNDVTCPVLAIPTITKSKLEVLVITSGITSIKENTEIKEKAFIGCDTLKSVTIPEGVVSIGKNAFQNCSKLASVELSNSIASIGNEVFYNCSSLTSIEIPESVNSIGAGAFYNCSTLTTITVSTNNTHYKSIAGNLYSKDGKKLLQYAIGKEEKAFTVPDGVTSINDAAFRGCQNLTSIVIAGSVTDIGENAFNGCENLANITFSGTKAQWDKIEKGNSWKAQILATKVVCSDGEVTL